MTATRPGIPTTFRSANFRSRLEARWAAFFDLVHWSWTYEPIDAEGYIPDFLINGDHPFFVEVGPCITERDYRTKAEKANRAAASLRYDLLIVGASPLPRLPLVSGYLAAGWLGEVWLREDFPAGFTAEGDAGYEWGTGVWARSGTCLAVYHTWSSYHHRPHRGHETPLQDWEAIEDLWSQAGNHVQWRAS